VKRSIVWAGAVLAAVCSLGFTCGPGPPTTDSCANATAATPAGIELGHAGSGEFRAFAPGDGVSIEIGSQGGAMIGVRLRMRGDDVPACVAQMTSVEMGSTGESLATSASALNTYAESDGSRTTKTNWLIMGFVEPSSGDEVTITARVGGVETSRTLQVQ
jgi:hypothetical protein